MTASSDKTIRRTARVCLVGDCFSAGFFFIHTLVYVLSAVFIRVFDRCFHIFAVSGILNLLYERGIANTAEALVTGFATYS